MKKQQYALKGPGRFHFLVPFLLSLIFLCPQVRAQEIKKDRKVTGVIVNSVTGLPVAGAAIKLKGSRAGTLSDSTGSFSVTAPATTKFIIVSSIGYKEMEMAIAANGVMNINLVATAQDLNDVVVVAYGTQKKISMVSSIVSITPKEIKGPTGNLTTMLAGRIAGIISYQRSGEPGADNAQYVFVQTRR